MKVHFICPIVISGFAIDIDLHRQKFSRYKNKFANIKTTLLIFKLKMIPETYQPNENFHFVVLLRHENKTTFIIDHQGIAIFPSFYSVLYK